MNYFRMPTKELREELKKRGLKGYSSLKKIQMIEYLSTGIHPLRHTVEQVNYHGMRSKELREELKKRGLKRYSSLKKAQMVEYLSTGIHPLDSTQVSPKIVGGEIRDPSFEGIGYSPTLLEEPRNFRSIRLYRGTA